MDSILVVRFMRSKCISSLFYYSIEYLNKCGISREAGWHRLFTDLLFMRLSGVRTLIGRKASIHVVRYRIA